MTAVAADEAGGQGAVFRFLGEASNHPGATQVDVIETHGNVVFLAGPFAWKVKRAIHFPYMDFSTLDLRRRACLEEMAVNARLAPDLYIACQPITREASGTLAIDGIGEPVEWVVKMHRFEQGDLLSARAAAGPLPAELTTAVADCVRASHDAAEVAGGPHGHARMASVLRNLVAALREAPLDQALVARFAQLASDRLAAVGDLLDKRAANGCVRRCHGDLHAANIVVWNGRPVLYDAIEFDRDLATIDTLYDLAFLLMDLDRRGQRTAANAILNRYLWLGRSDLDLEGLAALPLFLSVRAAIRSLVTGERAAQETGTAGEADLRTAHDLLRAAIATLGTAPPTLVAVAGLSGTGKSTLAARLAPSIPPPPGAVHLRSDLIRKALAGVGATDRLPAATYTREASARVYAELARQARIALAAGASVVADAVSAHAEERAGLRRIAQEMNVPFRGLWLTAPPETLVARVAARRNDASDATADVVRTQITWQTGDPGDGWATIDASGTPEASLNAAQRVLGDLLSVPSDSTDPDP
jgi:aminoglycoside phosphotransferase family enzyme/predicted kinase